MVACEARCARCREREWWCCGVVLREKMELWWCCGGALQRLDAAAMAGTSFTLAEKMNSRWIRSCRDGGSSREDLDLFWFMVVREGWWSVRVVAANAEARRWRCGGSAVVARCSIFRRRGRQGGSCAVVCRLDARWWRRETKWRWSRWQRLDARIGGAVVAGEVRRCGGGCHGGGRREEN